MTSVLPASDYAAVGEMENTITRTRKDKDRKKSKKDNSSRRQPLADIVDPLSDFYNEQKRSSPPPPPATYTIDDGAEDDYSDTERKHRPSTPPAAAALPPVVAAEKKSRRSTSNKRANASNNKSTPPHDTLSAAASSSSSAMKQSSPSSAYSPASLSSLAYDATRWSADDSLALREWLRDNHFDDSVWEALNEYSIADLLAVTKEDLKELLGVKQGIRLYARIQQYKQQQQLPIASSSPPQPSRRSAFSYSSASHSRYGVCAINGCTHASTNVCSMPSCNASLCMAHQNKSLLTGHVYCSACERETWEGKVRHGLQTVGERAEETTERIINTTAEWTGTGNHHPCTLPSTSRYGHMASNTLSQPSAASYYQEEHKQHSPIQSHHGSLNGAPAAGGRLAGLGFMGDWLHRDDGVEELDGAVDGSFYRERSWNDKQCAIQ